MHIDIDKYAHRNSFFHGWEPRAKLISLLCLITAISFAKSIVILLYIMLFAVTCVLLSNIPVRVYVKRALYSIIILMPVLILLPLTAGGAVLVDLYSIKIYYSGVILAVLILLRLILIITFFSILFMTNTFSELIAVLRALHLPAKLVDLVLFSYRYIYVFFEDIRRMRLALTLRGYHNRSTFFSFSKNAGLLGTLLIRSYEQTEQIYSAMLTRGYMCGRNQDYMHRVRVYDLLKVVLFLCVILIIIVAGFYI